MCTTQKDQINEDLLGVHHGVSAASTEGKEMASEKPFVVVA